jgi:hypothetical protein
VERWLPRNRVADVHKTHKLRLTCDLNDGKETTFTGYPDFVAVDKGADLKSPFLLNVVRAVFELKTPSEVVRRSCDPQALLELLAARHVSPFPVFVVLTDGSSVMRVWDVDGVAGHIRSYVIFDARGDGSADLPLEYGVPLIRQLLAASVAVKPPVVSNVGDAGAGRGGGGGGSPSRGDGGGGRYPTRRGNGGSSSSAPGSPRPPAGGSAGGAGGGGEGGTPRTKRVPLAPLSERVVMAQWEEGMRQARAILGGMCVELPPAEGAAPAGVAWAE